MLTAVLLLVGSADNVELEALRKVDQADRHFVTSPQEIDWESVNRRDAARQHRVRELLLADEVKTASDFDSAALIMQHGSKSSDFLLAHELASIAAYKGKLGSLPALTQDRWLESLGRSQRWGSQFDWNGNVKQIAPSPAPVTDQMRRDMLLPTMDEIQRLGVKAPMNDIDGKIDYLQKRLDSKLWKNTLKSRPALSAALRTVIAQTLNTSADYVFASKALLDSKEPDELLLAHELSVIAMGRRHPGAPRLFSDSLDAYLGATGLPKRYASGAVSPAVHRELRLRR